MGKKFTDPGAFYACIGKDRTCGRPSRPHKVTCEECGDHVTVTLPDRVLIRAHFAQTSENGRVITNTLVKEGVRVITRTKERQEELALKHMFSKGIRVFGENDLGPNVALTTAVQEISKLYKPSDVHIIEYDDSFAEKNPEKVGARVVVTTYERVCQEGISFPKAMQPILGRPFLSARVWVNLIDAEGKQVHCIELKGFQFERRPKFLLRFHGNAVWTPQVTPDDYQTEQ